MEMDVLKINDDDDDDVLMRIWLSRWSVMFAEIQINVS